MKLGSVYQPQVSEAEALAAARINAAVKKALEEDGLGSWIEPVPAGQSEEVAVT
jgi:hypothetical protein